MKHSKKYYHQLFPELIVMKYIKTEYSYILKLGVCILLRVLDQVQGFPCNATLFQ
jgi:hypothetical protein